MTTNFASDEIKEIILTMLQNKGVYPGEEPAVKIFGYSNHPDRYEITNYVVLWNGDEMEESDIYNSSFYFNVKPLMIDAKLTRYDYQEIEKLKKYLKK